MTAPAHRRTVARRPLATRATGDAHDPRAGVSLVEVLVALTVLGIALLSMARFSVSLTRTVTNEDLRGVAGEIAASRLELVKGGAVYDALDTAYAEPIARPVPGNPLFTRRTLITRVGGGATDLVDYKVVTVIVASPRLGNDVRRTTVIGDF